MKRCSKKAIAILSLVLSGTAHAQSPVSYGLSCKILTRCDQLGECKASNDSVVFDIDGVNTSYHGEGTYTVSYQGGTYDSVLNFQLGPLHWSESVDDLQTLSPTSQSGMLWQSYSFSEPPSAAVKFLDCEVIE